jgi:HEAT repeat protein
VREPPLPAGGVGDLARALSEPDPVTRGLAALALRDKGAAARPALDALVSALTDADPDVRMTSGSAIAAIGPDAAPAVPALIAACSVKEEQVQVLRSCATALGRIGKPAASALPVLRVIAQQPRVRWAAEAAIRNIEGR